MLDQRRAFQDGYTPVGAVLHPRDERAIEAERRRAMYAAARRVQIKRAAHVQARTPGSTGC